MYSSHPAQLVSRKEKVNSLLRGLNQMSKGVAVLAPGCTEETDLIATIGPLFNASVVRLQYTCILYCTTDIVFRLLMDSQSLEATPGIRTILACFLQKIDLGKDLPDS